MGKEDETRGCPDGVPGGGQHLTAEGGRATLRLCCIAKPGATGAAGAAVGPGQGAASSCGFHISRTQWDPYPWVSAVETGSPAEQSGLRPGDCVLEVNGEDVLGQRIGDVAAKVRAGRAKERLQLLVWNAGCDPGTAVTLTAGSGPTPLNLQLLSSCLQQASQLLECPVCLEGVSPPVWQCCHGHLLCSGCRSRSDRCPLCRVPLGPRGRSLLADKLHDLLTQTYLRYSEQRQGGAPSSTPAALQDDQAAEAQQQANEDAVDQRVGVLTRGQRLTASSEDVSAPAPAPTGQQPRARSQSAGHIGVVLADGKEDPVVHCPYGSTCPNTCPASEVFNHLREDHDVPLLQYFPREGRELSLPRPELPERRSSLTALTTKAGDTMFLHAERGCMWLWALDAAAPRPAVGDDALEAAPAAEASAVVAAAASTLRVDVAEDAELRLLPVFPLTASCEDVIASGRCVRLPQQEVRISVRVAPTGTPSPGLSTATPPPPATLAAS